MFVGQVNNRGITLEKLETLCRQCCYDGTVYQLNVTDGSTCFRVPLKDWLHHTYTNYINLLVKVNKRRIAKTEFDIAVNQALPIIADYILNKNPKATDKELVTKLRIPQEVVTSVMGKPISYLRNNKDTADRVKNLKARLKELKKFNPKVYAEEIIKRL
jgi:GTP1/Obg family GTP-binding protein